MSDCVHWFVNLTLIVTSSPSTSPQLCNQVSFSESGQRSSSRSKVFGFERSNFPQSKCSTGGYQRDSIEAKRFVELDCGVKKVGGRSDQRDVTESFHERGRNVQGVCRHNRHVDLAN